MNKKLILNLAIVAFSGILSSCSYSPIKSFGTYNYGARQMAIGVENPPKDSMVIETTETDSTPTEAPKKSCKPAEPTQGDVANVKNDEPQLPEEVKKLQAENEFLKQEIQNLRTQLAQLPTQVTPSQTPTPEIQRTTPNQTEEKQVTEYWLTSSSRKRHNSSCRYYQSSNGKPCGPEDGIPCKICGG